MKEETRPYNKRLAEKQGSAIDLDVGPPLDAKQVGGLLRVLIAVFGVNGSSLLIVLQRCDMMV